MIQTNQHRIVMLPHFSKKEEISKRLMDESNEKT